MSRPAFVQPQLGTPSQVNKAAMSDFFAIREASEEPPEEFMVDLTRRYMLARPYLGSSQKER